MFRENGVLTIYGEVSVCLVKAVGWPRSCTLSVWDDAFDRDVRYYIRSRLSTCL